MGALQFVELAVAAVLLVSGGLMVKRGRSQSGTLLLVAGVLIAVHGLGLMDYRPSAAETDMMTEGSN